MNGMELLTEISPEDEKLIKSPLILQLKFFH